MADHRAASKAPLTSRLTITNPAVSPSVTTFLTVMAASVVVFCGVNPYWFLFLQL